MFSQDRAHELMIEAIDEAEKSVSEDAGVHPKVGAILADSDGNIIARSHRGELGNGDHAEYIIIKKAVESKLNLKDTALFVTLEPCAARGPGKTPCAQRIVDSGIKTVYIGTIDTHPKIHGAGEVFLREHIETVERFPSFLETKIRESNIEFFQQYRKSKLPQSSLYVNTQISDIILDNLKRSGLQLNNIPIDWDVTLEDLVYFCEGSRVPEITSEELLNIVRKARATAYGKKYSAYTYDSDVRGLDDNWKMEVTEILKILVEGDYTKRHIINVGIGNGIEGQGLFDDIRFLTAVDIAEDSLSKVKVNLPNATIVCAEAESLIPVPTGSQDIYISLRAYQSSYFNIPRAIREAYRVIRCGGVVLISIANGFLDQNKLLIPGLVVPKSTIVDRDRPFVVAEKVRRGLSLLRFEEIGIRTGLGEIYVYGRRP